MFYLRSAHTMWRQRTSPRLVRIAMLVAGSAALLVLGMFLQTFMTEPNSASGPTYYSTEVGEHTFVWLENTLTVTVNTASRIVVDPGMYPHRVRLLQGEAAFRAGPTSRSLQVTSGDLEFYSQGATFDVRRRDLGTEVTVIDGQVRLISVRDESRHGVPIFLSAGQQLVIAGGSDIHRFQPRSLTSRERERLIAWEEGHLVFEGQALSEAAAEFNRYNRRQLVIDDDGVRRLTIGGIFSTGDVDSFIAALHRTLGVKADPPGPHEPNQDIVRLVRDTQ